MKIGEENKNDGNVMAKTIFACKQIEEFPNQDAFAINASFYAVFPGFSENLFMCNRPGHAGNRNR
ncbi:hypothetical protein [Pedobacter mendelii]|uniref:Uncharacterized protein n=1 Tax=Pedobacter mendelii TaxID=1908240 RepID=A0ABQ2BHU9_9SPHI|nr:hypothetical protein [Pedobacter mendelii]GGI26508.1 hypothetical protein GCM10008119_23010 [Pedobacter mendelii]